MTGTAPRTPDFRWVEGPVGCTDLIDAAGQVRGYVGPTARGTRGYVVQSGSEWPPRPAAFADHPTDGAARAWVEARISGRNGR